MADYGKSRKVSLEELMVSTLAMTDSLARLLIAKGTAWSGRNYLAMLKRMH